MESRNVLVKVHREEIKTSHARFDCAVVLLENIVKVVGCLGGDGPDLLVTPSVARDEENWNAPDLYPTLSVTCPGFVCKFVGPQALADSSRRSYPGIIIYSLLSVEIEGVFAGEAGVFCVKVVQPRVGRAHVRHATAFRVNLSCDERVEYQGKQANARHGNG
jgi:hypothetical protein